METAQYVYRYSQVYVGEIAYGWFFSGMKWSHLLDAPAT